MLKKKNHDRDWSNTGSFINKPQRGWLHPDEYLNPSAGVCYGVRYIGAMEVKQSMKSLDFETRTALTKEAIGRVCEVAGLKNPTKKTKRSGKVAKMLGDQPNLVFAGSNVNLTITTDSLTIVVMETGDLVASHEMPTVSFASGGDPDTMDFVAYVAKDTNGRACHVLECGGGLAQDVITTMGQAFELRYKLYLASKTSVPTTPPRLENMFQQINDVGWDDEEADYYNDHPGAMPPSPTSPPQYSKQPLPPGDVSDTVGDSHSSLTSGASDRVMPPPAPPRPAVGEGTYTSVYSKSGAAEWSNGASGYSKAAEAGFYDNPGAAGGHLKNDRAMYDNKHNSDINPAYDNYKTPQCLGFEGILYDNKENVQQVNGQVPKPEYMNYPDKPPEYDNPKASVPQVAPPSFPQPSNGQLDPFDMQPFGSTLPSGGQAGNTLSSPYNEPWFQGKIPRQQMLRNDGDFLVRESSNSTGQFVLSSRQGGHIKHLLLVDPEGVVRTKDREFGSVSDLINYHRDNNIPIISNDCEILLQTPILNS